MAPIGLSQSVNGYIRPNFTFGVDGELLNQIPSYLNIDL